jgi:pimeloyl-ACP methyl ester carboxylesterase
MLKWFKVALYVVGGILALHVLALFIVPVIGGFRMGIDAPDGIDEAFYATVNGREEYVTIRGQDKANPAVLVVHGGPGFGHAPMARDFWPYEKTYTLIQWDQPGAGRSFRRAGNTIPADLTVEDIVDDGIAVAEYVRERLGVDKLIVLGQSWGTAVGIQMAKKRPDLFIAYVGSGQVTSIAEQSIWGYERAMSKARDTGNAEAIEILETVGQWPYRTIDDWRTARLLQRELDGEPPPLANHIPAYFAPGHSLLDAISYSRAAIASRDHFIGEIVDGPQISMDLPRDFTSFDVPIFMFQGEEDWKTPAVLAKRYFDLISAPQKVYVPMPGEGHGVMFFNPEEFIALMDKYVRPLVANTN